MAPAGQCSFELEPLTGYLWDSSCKMGMLGCYADGANVECRFCGEGAYASILCPPSSCHFPSEPEVPYYWDQSCESGKLGCWADGVHLQCRFCGEAPYTSIACPEVVAVPNVTACAFANEPEIQYYWDPSCQIGVKGCFADGKHIGCRFCGSGEYGDVPCPADSPAECTFANEPGVPYFWDKDCAVGKLGCLADGIHEQCRFCAHRPFESVSCPGRVAPPEGSCTFPAGAEPAVPFFWDESCELGRLGCWADGIHAQCRFCGIGVYYNITCGASASAGTGMASPAAQAASDGGARTMPSGSVSAAVARDIAPGSQGSAGENDDDVEVMSSAWQAGALGVCASFVVAALAVQDLI